MEIVARKAFNPAPVGHDVHRSLVYAAKAANGINVVFLVGAEFAHIPEQGIPGIDYLHRIGVIISRLAAGHQFATNKLLQRINKFLNIFFHICKNTKNNI